MHLQHHQLFQLCLMPVFSNTPFYRYWLLQTSVGAHFSLPSFLVPFPSFILSLPELQVLGRAYAPPAGPDRKSPAVEQHLVHFGLEMCISISISTQNQNVLMEKIANGGHFPRVLSNHIIFTMGARASKHPRNRSLSQSDFLVKSCKIRTFDPSLYGIVYPYTVAQGRRIKSTDSWVPTALSLSPSLHQLKHRQVHVLSTPLTDIFISLHPNLTIVSRCDAIMIVHGSCHFGWIDQQLA